MLLQGNPHVCSWPLAFKQGSAERPPVPGWAVLRPGQRNRPSLGPGLLSLLRHSRPHEPRWLRKWGSAAKSQPTLIQSHSTNIYWVSVKYQILCKELGMGIWVTLIPTTHRRNNLWMFGLTEPNGWPAKGPEGNYWNKLRTRNEPKKPNWRDHLALGSPRSVCSDNRERAVPGENLGVLERLNSIL